MREQLHNAVVTAGLAERLKQTQELVQQLLNAEKMRELLGEEATQDAGHRDCCEALKARELEIRNEIRKLEGKPPMVPVQRRTLTEQFLGGSHTELVEQEPEKEQEPEQEPRRGRGFFA